MRTFRRGLEMRSAAAAEAAEAAEAAASAEEGGEPPPPLRPDEAMKLIAGDDWVPLRGRKRRAREAAGKRAAAAEEEEEEEEKEEEEEEKEGKELAPGEIDISTYGLDEPDDHHHPFYRRTGGACPCCR